MLKDLLFLTVLFFANVIQTVTGFAGNLIAMPLSVHIVGYDTAKAVLNIFTILSCGIITCKNRTHTDVKELFKMCSFMLLGMFVGIKLTEKYNLNILSDIYGALIILTAVKKLFIKREINLPSLFMPVILLSAGIIHGMFVSGGSLLVIYAVSVLPDKDRFRATVAPVWVVLGIFLAVSHYSEGLYSKPVLFLCTASLLPLAASIKAGTILYSKLNPKAFLNITYILLLISGVIIYI